MINRRHLAPLLFAAAFLPGALRAQPPVVEEFTAWAGRAGSEVRVVWTVPSSGWPAGGYLVERLPGRGNGRRGSRLGVARLGADTSGLSAAQSSSLDVAAGLAELDAVSSPDAELQRRIARLTALTDFGLARALGLAWVDTSVDTSVDASVGASATSGARYRITALAADGRPLDAVTSGPVGSEQPPPPAALTATAGRDGVALRWKATPAAIPVVGFEVLRAGVPAAVGRPIAGGESVEFLDREAPAGQFLNYSLRSMDVLGRVGPPGSVAQVYLPDWAALAPPELEARATTGEVRLGWLPAAEGNLIFEVARGLTAHGPFETLAEQPGRDFVDRSGRPGTLYHYTVRARDAQGTVGDWATARSASWRGERPAAPRGLQAQRGATRLRLRWEPVAAPGLAGYRVERATSDGAFVLAEQRLLPTAEFDDAVPYGSGGRRRYRVSAVTWDDQVSRPSAEIAVELPDTRPPAAPRYVTATSTDGGVEVAWMPGGATEEVAGWVVLRSLDRRSDGLILTEKALAAEARTFIDARVTAGAIYSYRVVALDATGNRSAAASPATVRVAGGDLPTPPAIEIRAADGVVVLQFASPPAGVAWIVHRRAGDGDWERLAGPLASGTTQLADSAPPSGSITYRLIAVGMDGRLGISGPESSFSG